MALEGLRHFLSCDLAFLDLSVLSIQQAEGEPESWVGDFISQA